MGIIPPPSPHVQSKCKWSQRWRNRHRRSNLVGTCSNRLGSTHSLLPFLNSRYMIQLDRNHHFRICVLMWLQRTWLPKPLNDFITVNPFTSTRWLFYWSQSLTQITVNDMKLCYWLHWASGLFNHPCWNQSFSKGSSAAGLSESAHFNYTTSALNHSLAVQRLRIIDFLCIQMQWRLVLQYNPVLFQ